MTSQLSSPLVKTPSKSHFRGWTIFIQAPRKFRQCSFPQKISLTFVLFETQFCTFHNKWQLFTCLTCRSCVDTIIRLTKIIDVQRKITWDCSMQKTSRPFSYAGVEVGGGWRHPFITQTTASRRLRKRGQVDVLDEVYGNVAPVLVGSDHEWVSSVVCYAMDSPALYGWGDWQLDLAADQTSWLPPSWPSARTASSSAAMTTLFVRNIHIHADRRSQSGGPIVSTYVIFLQHYFNRLRWLWCLRWAPLFSPRASPTFSLLPLLLAPIKGGRRKRG